MTSTITSEITTSFTTQNATGGFDVDNDGGSSVGIVIGAIVGVVFAVAVIALILAVFIKRKRERDSEYARAAKVQRNSAMNAGVYNDLSTASPIVKKPLDANKEVSEMERLNRADEEEVV